MPFLRCFIGRQGFARAASLISLALPSVAQDLEPRRWTHLPVGSNVAGLNYVYTTGDLNFDPVLELENVEVETNSLIAGFTHAFDFFGTTGRVDALLPYQVARWTGVLSGAPASTARDGFADPWVRLSVALLGAPALRGEDFMKYRTGRKTNTIVGLALGVMLPLGEYQPERLLNLGQNRFIFRPQLGVTHTRGSWSYELTVSTFFYTENDDFYGGNHLEQDPLHAFQGHLVHTFPNRWWGSISAGYNWGGESEVNGVDKDDEKGGFLGALSLGLPIGKTQGLKLGYFRGDTLVNVGADTHSLFLSWNMRF